MGYIAIVYSKDELLRALDFEEYENCPNKIIGLSFFLEQDELSVYPIVEDSTLTVSIDQNQDVIGKNRKGITSNASHFLYVQEAARTKLTRGYINQIENWTSSNKPHLVNFSKYDITSILNNYDEIILSGASLDVGTTRFETNLPHPNYSTLKMEGYSANKPNIPFRVRGAVGLPCPPYWKEK